MHQSFKASYETISMEVVASMISVPSRGGQGSDKSLQYSWDQASTDGWKFIDVKPYNADLIAAGVNGEVISSGDIVVGTVKFHGGIPTKLHNVKNDLKRHAVINSVRIKRLVYLEIPAWMALTTNLQHKLDTRPYLCEKGGGIGGYGFTGEAIMKHPWLAKTGIDDPMNNYRKNIWFDNVIIDAVCVTNGTETIYVVCNKVGQQVGM